MLATLFSSFDVLLDWQNLLGINTFLGMSLAFLMSGLANSFYVWAIIDIFYAKESWSAIHKRQFFIYTLLEIASNGVALILRLNTNSFATLFTIVHMLLGFIAYLVMFKCAHNLSKSVKEEQYRSRFLNLRLSALFMLLLSVFFLIDSLYVEFTIYSLIGWACVFFAVYGLYRSLV